MMDSNTARVLPTHCHTPNPYSGWYPPSAHQMGHPTHQGSFLHFAGAPAAPAQVVANQAAPQMYNLHNQYHQYHTAAVGNPTSTTSPAMTVSHGFITNPHHPPAFTHHPAPPGVESGGQLGAMGGHFPAAFMLNVERAGSELSLTQIQRPRKKRQPYSKGQINNLEREYRSNNFITRQKREQIARDLKLTDRQVKIWFQNRRVKDKKIKQREMKDSQQHHRVISNGHRDHAMKATNGFTHRHAPLQHMSRDLHIKAEEHSLQQQALHSLAMTTADSHITSL